MIEVRMPDQEGSVPLSGFFVYCRLPHLLARQSLILEVRRA